MRNLIVSFRKILTSRGFYLCVGMTLVLLFATEVYTDQDTQNRYSVIRALTDLAADKRVLHYELCNIMVMQNARGSWISMFTPIITAFCFVPQMCAERDGNATRFQVFRTSKLKYNVSQFLSGIIAAGSAVMIGYVLFCGAVYFLFPGASAFSGFEAEMLANINFSPGKLLLEMWLYGVFWSIPAMFCTSVMRNKYLIMCIPFFAKYALTQTVQKLSQNAFADIENIDTDMLKFTNIVNPDGLLWITETPERTAPALLFGITAAVFAAGYLIIKQNWRDSGA